MPLDPRKDNQDQGRIPGGYVTNHVYTWVDPQGRSVSPPPDLPEHRSSTMRRTDTQRRSHLHLLQEGDEKKVNLVMDNGRSLGLMIRGGAEYNLGIYITGVDRGSAAEFGGLKGISGPLPYCLETPLCVYVVPSRPGNWAQWPEEVKHAYGAYPSAAWAFSHPSRLCCQGSSVILTALALVSPLKPSVCAPSKQPVLSVPVPPPCPLSALPPVQVGDQILEVNGRSFLGIPHDEAVRVLKSSRHLMMTVKDVGRLPHARTVVGETKWIASSQIADGSPQSSVAGLSMDQGASVSEKPVFYKGVAGSQVTLSSLVNQSRAMLEEQARHLLTQPERQTMSYYLEEYRDGHVGVEQLVMALFELFNTHAKFSLLSEVRGLVAPQDLERFDGMVLRREIEALKARQGAAAAANPDSFSMVSYPDTLTSSASYLTSTTLSSARNDSTIESSNTEEPQETTRDLPDISLDDVRSTTDSPPSFKPPPPPGVQRRHSHRDQAKRPSSDSSHSGLYFTAPLRSPQDMGPDPPVPDPRRKEVVATQLSLVTRHPIRPFPRVQSPSRAAPATLPSMTPHAPRCSLPTAAPPSPDKPLPPSPASNQHFVMVEVHRPNAEPDVNEVRPLPQARGATLSQLSDSGQTLSEDSGVDITESGRLSKDSSPRPSRTRPPQDAQAAEPVSKPVRGDGAGGTGRTEG
ncbi:hypothetical protein Z043_106199 [Scleropages formosus]|uniref:PDZ domain-containing protein n=1 Tax=Scleropages formosus TaxID=113540 RepID=A0A0P7UX12_SCLFO|nr:hypothetical protein Z043_106199 [Scleropages formosus]